MYKTTVVVLCLLNNQTIVNFPSPQSQRRLGGDDNMCTNQEGTNIILVFSVLTAVQSLPIYNGFSVNFSPMLMKEETRPKTFGALFAKVPQELPRRKQDAITQAIFSNVGFLGAGCTNQIAKILFPSKRPSNERHNITSWADAFINIPIIKQPVDDYKILIVAAPPNVNINKANDSKPLIVYIVFPQDDISDANLNIPTIYFVNESKGHIDINTKQKFDPFIIVDHNRTVTKLKSNDIAKFVRFRNKLINHYHSVSKL